MNNSKMFPFGCNSVRVYEVEGDTLFDAADVCMALGFTDLMEAIGDMEYAIIQNRFTGEKAYVLPESSVYLLCMSSETEEAKKFQNWVWNEVLPAIGKTGRYTGNNVS